MLIKRSEQYFYDVSSRWLLLLCITIASCGIKPVAPASEIDDLSGSAERMDRIDPELTAAARELMAAYLEQIELDLGAADKALNDLYNEINVFLDSPDDRLMERVQNSWLTAHSAYELTALHRYFADLVLVERDSLALFQLQYQINHWPILPGYIDYLGSYTDSGIVSDITIALELPGLRQQHGSFDLSEVILGFHALEFLIWGENLDRVTPRPPSDYEPITQLPSAQSDSGIELLQLGNNRRRQLLVVITEALIDDFQSTQSLWRDGSIAFSENLQSMASPELFILFMEAMTNMLTQEFLVRSLYPLLNGEYLESIQSPFSHSTQNAVSAQLSGLERLLLESSTETGSTLDSLLVDISTDFEEFFYQNFDASKECLVLLYSSLEEPQDPGAALRTEFEIVECINLLTSMIDHLEQIKIGLSSPI